MTLAFEGDTKGERPEEGDGENELFWTYLI